MKNLLSLQNISKSYTAKNSAAISILHNINLHVSEKEIVAVLGPSGAGKSTLLRIIAGLIPTSNGSVSYMGKEVSGINPGTAMVFQSFALFPWLTVMENTLLGLAKVKMSSAEKTTKAKNLLSVVGLDEFADAYPKELSGGMCQRVGIARAIIGEPDILLMDEAFSALDVLTAKNLRHDLLQFWLTQKLPIKSIILVTHNIEEAVSMADRVIILGGSPATIREEIPILLPHWRDKKSAEFIAYVDEIYSLMTKKTTRLINNPVAL